MSSKQPGSMKSLLSKAGKDVDRLRRFSVVGFVVFVAIIYGFVFIRMNGLNNEQPAPDTINNQVQAARVPHIDKSVVKQLESLHDNSVNVRTLFNQARSNPFSSK